MALLYMTHPKYFFKKMEFLNSKRCGNVTVMRPNVPNWMLLEHSSCYIPQKMLKKLEIILKRAFPRATHDVISVTIAILSHQTILKKWLKKTTSVDIKSE